MKTRIRLLLGVLLAFFLASTGCCERNDTIFVNGYCHGDVVPNYFSYEVPNVRICVTGAEYDFYADDTKEKLFDGVASSFEVFERNDEKISVIYNGEVFTIKQVQGEDDRYILYGEYIMHAVGNNDYYDIPFPTDQIKAKHEKLPRINTDCFEADGSDWDYYTRFYSIYPDITVTGNQIEGEEFVLSVNGDQITIQIKESD